MRDEDYQAFSQESSQQESDSDDEENIKDYVKEVDVDEDTLVKVLRDLKMYNDRLDKLFRPIERLLNSKPKMFSPEGRKYLKNYKNLLSLYCGQLYFFLLLHLEGGVKRNHPVLLRLIETRKAVESSEPIYKEQKKSILMLVKEILKSERANTREANDSDSDEDKYDDKDVDLTLDQKLKKIQLEAKEKEPITQESKVSKKSKKKQKRNALKDVVVSLGVSKSYLGKRGTATQQQEQSESDDEDVLNLTKGLSKKTTDSIPKSNGIGIDVAALKKVMGSGGLFGDQDDDIDSDEDIQVKHTKRERQIQNRATKKDIEAYKQKAEEIEIENSKRKQLKKIKTDEQNQEKFDLAFAQDKVTGDDDARNITRDMLINKGLVRKRKKIISKIRLKNKYKKAIHTMKSRGNYVRDYDGKYDGEERGINQKVVRNVRLTT